jgi:beta-lactam-binding protein with PASTA domain
VLALVRNQSAIVDNYDVVVHGLPREWWTVNPATVYLVPLGKAGAYEQEVEIILHPPRTPEAEARRWELEVGVYSRASEAEVATAPFTLGILPYEQYAIRVRPERASGRLRAKYDVRIANSANAVVLLALDAADSDGECDFRFDSQKVEVPTGSTKDVQLEVKPPAQVWIGRPLERRFEIVAAGGEAGEQLLASKLEDDDGANGGGRLGRLAKSAGVVPPKVSAPKVSVGPGGVNVKGPQARAPQVRPPKPKAINLSRPTLGLRALKQADRAAAPATPPPLLPTQAIFRQKAWLPWWLSIVVPLLALLGLLLFLLLPKQVTVPDVVGSEGVFAAQEKLTQAGLVVGSREEKTSKDDKPGTVLAQSPAAGTDVEKGSPVSLELAVSGTEKTVPKLKGLTLAEADKKLVAEDLTRGTIFPNPPDLKAKITSTLPEAGTVVKGGSPVDIFLADKKAKPGGGAAGGGAAGGGAGGAGGEIAVPEIKPTDLQGYGTTLAKAKLVPGATERQISDAPSGTVFATDPAVGTKVKEGTKIKLLISAGFPLMAFDAGGNVLLMHAGTGKRITPAIAKTAAAEKDPTWSADRTRVVYTAANQLMAADPDHRERKPIVLGSQDAQFADPSFAPTPDRALLAVSRFNGKDRDLCVGVVKVDGFTPSCMTDPGFATGFAQWAPDGRSILVPALSDKGTGIVRYTSKVPFSAKSADWGKGAFVTARTPDRFVRDMAISPDGKQVAAAANIDGGAFVLYLTKPGDLGLKKATKLDVPACKVIWLDSRTLAVVKLGSSCGDRTGEIVRLSVDKPTDPPVTITPDGDNPTFRPLAAEG